MQRFLCEVLAAGIGTVAFALIFHVPNRYYLRCGITGAAGWLVYLAFKPFWGVLPATFLAPFAVLCISRFWAVQLRCPATIFLISGIFPLVPGAGIYYTAYAFITGDTVQCAAKGAETLKIAVALAMGIAVVMSIPLKPSNLRRDKR